MQHSKSILQKPLSLYDVLRKACFPQQETMAEHEVLDKAQRDQWHTYLENFHVVLDAKLKASSNTFKKMLAKTDTTGYWHLWFAIFEEAAIEQGNLTPNPAKEWKSYFKKCGSAWLASC